MKNKAAGTLTGKTAIRINLKHFSIVNEQGGMTAGDTALRNYIAALTEAAGPGGILCRLGGDNFVALFDTERLPEVLNCLNGIPSPTTTRIGSSYPPSPACAESTMIRTSRIPAKS